MKTCQLLKKEGDIVLNLDDDEMADQLFLKI